MTTMQAFLWAGIFIIIYTYFLYPLLLVLLAVKRRKNVKHPENNELSVSIIISAYNEEKVIRGKIHNCDALDFPRHRLEVLIGSDGSTDLTGSIVRELTRERRYLKYFEFGRGGKAAVINALVKEAKGDVLVFSDANTMYDENAVSKLVNALVVSGAGCVCGKLILNEKNGKMEQGESFYWRYETAIKKLENSFQAVSGANGAIFAIWRRSFSPLPQGTINDDFLISMKAAQTGHGIAYEENAVAREYSSGSLIQEFRRHVRDGAGHYQAMMRLPGLLNPFLGWTWFSYVSHRLLRWVVPFILCLALILNMILLDIHIIYRCLFVLQLLFYAFSLAGFLLYLSGVTIKLFYVPFYFLAVNMALLAGFVKLVTGNMDHRWERTER